MKFLKFLILPLLVLGFATACDDDDEDIIDLIPSNLRAVHLAPPVDVEVDNETVLEDVSYTESSPYLEVPSVLNVKVKAAGTDTVVIDEDLVLIPDGDQTVIAVNFLADIEALLLFDNNTPPGDGNVKVRAVHGAPSAPNVDIYVTAPDADIEELEPTLTNIPFLGVSDYLEVPAADYRVRVTPTGTKTVVIDSGTLSLFAGEIRTIIARNAEGDQGEPFEFLILEDLN